MSDTPRRAWVPVAVLVGLAYALVGVAFALPGTHARAWRLAAWGVCAVGFAAHIAYERVRLRTSPRAAALHVALAVALGAFGLAVGANIHALSVGSTGTHRRRLLLSLAIWPVITAVPAFLVSLGLSASLARVLGSRRG